MLPFTVAEQAKNDRDKALAFLGLAYDQSIVPHIWAIERATSNHGMGATSRTTLPGLVVGNVLLSADVVVASSSLSTPIPDDVWMFVGYAYIDLRPLDRVIEATYPAPLSPRTFTVRTVSHNNPLLTICELDEYGQVGTRV